MNNSTPNILLAIALGAGIAALGTLALAPPRVKPIALEPVPYAKQKAFSDRLDAMLERTCQIYFDRVDRGILPAGDPAFNDCVRK